jgi:hypothetical protein
MGLVAMCYCTGASHGRTLDIRKARQGEGGLTRGWLLQAEMLSGGGRSFLMSAPPRSRVGKAATALRPPA